MSDGDICAKNFFRKSQLVIMTLMKIIVVVVARSLLKVHKRENFLGSDFEICTFSQLVMHKC
jgi:hypothetical protein